MEELHMMKATEDAVRKNVQAILEHGNDTRRMFRDLEAKVEVLERTILTQNGLLKQYQAQIGFLNAKVLGGGPTSDPD